MQRGTTYDINDILPNMLLVMRKKSPEEYDTTVRIMKEYKWKRDGNGEVPQNDNDG